MMLKKSIFILLAFFCMLPGHSYAKMERPDQQTLNQIESYVQRQFEKNGVTGGSYAIVAGGEVVAAKGIGMADQETQEKVTSKTLYSTASVTKALTATAILNLVEQGKIELDAPVKTYIPWFTYKDKSRSSKVTIRHLLTHSAGINRLEGDGALFVDEEKNRDSLENSIKSLRTVNMTADPGRQAAYCNSCFNTLGLVIEKVTGTDYETFINEQLFTPVGMESTTFDPANAEHVASEYNWVFGLKHKSDFNNVIFGESQNPEGGMYSNVLDLSKFLSVMLDAGPTSILRSETLAASQHGEISTGSEGTKYSISGFEESTIHDTRVLYKTGDGIGSTALIMMIPNQKMGITILIGDSIPELSGPLMKGIVEILLGKAPSDIDVGITFWRLVGLISLGLTIVSMMLITFFVRSLLLRKSMNLVKRTWFHVVRGLFFTIIALSLWYLMIVVHPSQIGFYGYPFDLAIGLVSIMISSTIWAVYSWVLFLLDRRNRRIARSSLTVCVK